MSQLISDAFRQWRAIRQEYQIYLEAHYQQAETDCNGVMLNRRGRVENVDPVSLFMGNYDRVELYASEELKEWFTRYGRMNYADFERQYLDYEVQSTF